MKGELGELRCPLKAKAGTLVAHHTGRGWFRSRYSPALCHQLSTIAPSLPAEAREPRPKGGAHADGHAPEGSTQGLLSGPAHHPAHRRIQGIAPCRPWRPAPGWASGLHQPAPAPSTNDGRQTGEGRRTNWPATGSHLYPNVWSRERRSKSAAAFARDGRPCFKRASLDPICHLSTKRGLNRRGHEGDPWFRIGPDGAGRAEWCAVTRMAAAPQRRQHPVHAWATQNSPLKDLRVWLNPAHPGCGPGSSA